MINVQRDAFHHNILKRVITRLDFQGVLESEMDNTMTQVKQYARERGFSRFDERILRQLDINFSDGGGKDSIANTSDVRRQIVYSFIDDNRGYSLDVSNNHICLSINNTRYIPFEDYCSIIPDIANILNSSVYYFAPKRLGLRKINECLVPRLDQIKVYFSPTLFSFYDHGEGVHTVSCVQTNHFTVDNYHVNLLTNIAQGTKDKVELYCVRVDIDLHLDNSEQIKKIFSDTTEFAHANNIVFNIFVSSLTDRFIDLLSDAGDFDNSILIGVEPNE